MVQDSRARCYVNIYAAVINREPVESLKDGCDMIINSLICKNMCQGVMNTLQLFPFETNYT